MGKTRAQIYMQEKRFLWFAIVAVIRLSISLAAKAVSLERILYCVLESGDGNNLDIAAVSYA